MEAPISTSPTNSIILGDRYRDSVTGLEGVAVCSINYLHGRVRIGLQPPVGADGKVPETHYCDLADAQLLGARARLETAFKSADSAPSKWPLPAQRPAKRPAQPAAKARP